MGYTNHSKQLLSNKSVHKSIKEPNISDGLGRTDEDEWEGFGEDISEEQVVVSRLKGPVPLGKDTRKTEKKPRKREKKHQKRAASNLEQTRNSFEALGRADEDGATADIEEGDGKDD